MRVDAEQLAENRDRLKSDVKAAADEAAHNAQISIAELGQARQVLEEFQTRKHGHSTERLTVRKAERYIAIAEVWTRAGSASASGLAAAAAAVRTASAAATAEATLKQMEESPGDRRSFNEAAAQAAAAARSAVAESTAAEAAAARTRAFTNTGTMARALEARSIGFRLALRAAQDAVETSRRWAQNADAEASVAKAAAERAGLLRGAEQRQPAGTTVGRTRPRDVRQELADELGVGSIPSVGELTVAGIIALAGAVAAVVGLAVLADEEGTDGWEALLVGSAGLAVVSAVVLAYAGQRRLAKMRIVRTSVADFERRVDEIDASAAAVDDPVTLADKGRGLRLLMIDAGARDEAESIAEKVDRLTALTRQRGPSGGSSEATLV